MFKFNLKEIWLHLTSKNGSHPRLQNYSRQQEKFIKRYPNYTIGTASYGMPIVHDLNEGSTLKIGAYCSVARNVEIFLGGNHRTDWVSNYPFPAFMNKASHIKDFSISRGDVIIGSDVWLCANCTILSGVTIGHGAVISRDVEPYSVMAGNPAKQVKWRFDEATRKSLLASKWWEWPEDEINKILDKLCTDDLTDFLNYSKSRQIIN
ncbi:MAG: CatB-related O-acetyltransferase [Pseudomonadota bacterium]